jgi:hypothetical protein
MRVQVRFTKPTQLMLVHLCEMIRRTRHREAHTDLKFHHLGLRPVWVPALAGDSDCQVGKFSEFLGEGKRPMAVEADPTPVSDFKPRPVYADLSNDAFAVKHELRPATTWPIFYLFQIFLLLLGTVGAKLLPSCDSIIK